MTDKEIKVPNIGTSAKVDVIEVLVKPGDQVKAEDPLVTLESDKASMEIPSPIAGTVKALKIKVGDKVSENDVILILETAEQAAAPKQAEKAAVKSAPEEIKKPVEEKVVVQEEEDGAEGLYAGPAARRLARELGVDLQKLAGSGRKGRIQLEDIHAFVKPLVQGAASSAGGFSLPASPQVDHSQYGEIEVKDLSKIKKISGANLQRNWIVVPHVTQFDEADITDLEAFRKTQNALLKNQNIKVTPLAFIMKAVVAALKTYPVFNASLDGDKLILKKYFHIGVAVDTPNGLVVAVIRDVDQKGIIDLSKELTEISQKARTKGLSLSEMQGSSFTISSLGGIGGTAFTPIVNLPDVAILGVSRSQIKPVYENGQFVPRLMLPLSLSYDHRVIDGADGARFSSYLAGALSDIRTIIM